MVNIQHFQRREQLNSIQSGKIPRSVDVISSCHPKSCFLIYLKICTTSLVKKCPSQSKAVGVKVTLVHGTAVVPRHRLWRVTPRVKSLGRKLMLASLISRLQNTQAFFFLKGSPYSVPKPFFFSGVICKTNT